MFKVHCCIYDRNKNCIPLEMNGKVRVNINHFNFISESRECNVLYAEVDKEQHKGKQRKQGNYQGETVVTCII